MSLERHQVSAVHGDRAHSSGWDPAHEHYRPEDEARMAQLTEQIARAHRVSCPGCGKPVMGDECERCGSLRKVKNRIAMAKRRAAARGHDAGK